MCNTIILASELAGKLHSHTDRKCKNVSDTEYL